jgi:hypothetical protein
LGLDLDWIQIQQSLEPDRFREKPGSGSGFRESGYETLG